MNSGWRRFGRAMFRPACGSCSMCQALRVDVAAFKPNQSQKRAWKRNHTEIGLTISEPKVSEAKLALYDRYHEFQSEHVGWRPHTPKDAAGYEESFVEQPFPVQEWCYWLGDELVGVGYVDDLPCGPSAIYFYYEPSLRDRSLGTFNVWSIIAAAAKQQQQHVYLGYHVEGCRSLEYKANYKPNEKLIAANDWQTYNE
jgi:leucyl-tRNA---protein transferase